jgi:hypothetical protein
LSRDVYRRLISHRKSGYIDALILPSNTDAIFEHAGGKDELK